VSVGVQNSPSLQEIELFAYVQSRLAVHVSVVQTLLSLQSALTVHSVTTTAALKCVPVMS